MIFYNYNWEWVIPMDRMLVYFFPEECGSYIQDVLEITFIIIVSCFWIMELEQQRAFLQVIVSLVNLK